MLYYISLFSKIRCSLTYLPSTYLPKNLTSYMNAPLGKNQYPPLTLHFLKGKPQQLLIPIFFVPGPASLMQWKSNRTLPLVLYSLHQTLVWPHLWIQWSSALIFFISKTTIYTLWILMMPISKIWGRLNPKLHLVMKISELQEIQISLWSTWIERTNCWDRWSKAGY